jgi:hypothetical protein
MNGTIEEPAPFKRPPGLENLIGAELTRLAANPKLREVVRAEFSRRNGAHPASARQSEKQRRKDEQLERQIKLREQTNAMVISVPSADGSLPAGHKCAHVISIL